ncbi:PREDICTED: probable G-protein coupled receptor 61 [Lepidothrix coronata]|uniref:Probable G-protein coupled receptor 61 n=1 Tax=Lepidothrix coronata TaxID=321398 RepID=A0A6J0J7K3_9PASS|nr:PREDICTED: probable G-protein coupled receptor 61 [Lepidothrix coronata]
MEPSLPSPWGWNGSRGGGARPPNNGSAEGKAKDGGGAARAVGLLFMVLLDLTALVGNAAVVGVIARTPALRKFVFVLHLCLVDLVAALTLMPLEMLVGSALGGSPGLCRVYLFLLVCLSSVCILSISTLSLERYYSVVHPLRYEAHMTPTLVAGVLAAVWLKAVATSVVPVLGWLSPPERPPAPGCSLQWSPGAPCVVFVAFLAAFYFALPLLVIVLTYCAMFRVARVAAAQRGPLPTWLETPPPARRRSASLSSRSPMVTPPCPGGAPRSTPHRTPGAGGGKAAAVPLAVGGQFLLCWLPFFSFQLYAALGGARGGGAAETVVTWLGFCCFTSNPFFYGCLNRQIRAELGRLVATLLKQPPEEGLRLPSREGSIQENFLQFLQSTGRPPEPPPGTPRRDLPPSTGTPRRDMPPPGTPKRDRAPTPDGPKGDLPPPGTPKRDLPPPSLSPLWGVGGPKRDLPSPSLSPLWGSGGPSAVPKRDASPPFPPVDFRIPGQVGEDGGEGGEWGGGDGAWVNPPGGSGRAGL